MLKILNASPRFGAPLSEQETKDFLTTKALMLHIGTVDERSRKYSSELGTITIIRRKTSMSKKEHTLKNRESRDQMIYFCMSIPQHHTQMCVEGKSESTRARKLECPYSPQDTSS
jgi:hypothetical protein